jgi:recombinational DNA repair protein (RecF pathway)
MTVDERTHCEECSVNFDDDGFDYRFERPVCHSCVEKLGLKPKDE